MDIDFKTTKLKKSFNEGSKLVKIYGVLRAKKISLRMMELRAADSLMDFWPPESGPARCHEISKGHSFNKMSVDLDHPYRLTFKPNHDPTPLRDEGGLDWSQVTAITILGVENTHER
ncbi:MAG: killer suppression protein [Magnetococcales bacterium]|nr:killer suppression protein [Magnetococcales bacterium]